jgi:hypothetical protein
LITNHIKMDDRANAVRQRLKAKMVKKEMEEKKKKARLEKKEKKRVDGILTADVHRLFSSEEPLSLTDLTTLYRKTDPGYEPTGCGTYNEYGRAVLIPWAEALEREQNGTLYRSPSLNKYGAKSFVKQIMSGRVKIHFSCENCNKVAQGVEPPLEQCSDCMVVAYCSRECQVGHWKKQHKHDCALMKVEGCGSFARHVLEES